ncbi:MAG TPA: peptidylprolyl isomerase [Prolixibacteraceae bacterium]|nr:peptidylprolyl isomerase [Prolixibacteraceae bacterium]
MKLTLSIFVILLLFSCSNSKERKESNKERQEQKAEGQQETGGKDVSQAVVKIDSYDDDRILESGQGFFIAPNLVVTKYSLVNRANNVQVSMYNSNQKFTTEKYAAFDRINDLILLNVEGSTQKPVELFKGTVPNSAKTSYVSMSSGKTIQLFTGKVLNLATANGTKLYRLTNKIRKSNFGTPIFVSNKKVIGLAFSDVVNYQEQSFAIPSFFISDLLAKKMNQPQTLESLNSFSSEKTAAENRNIKGLVLETDLGDITIRLFNETPQYRDNFIKLVKENFYDSLLIHRVISDFGIQTGAADTRYADKDDIVGWKGPGYTIPSHTVPGLFHKRGMIGSPRKPDTKNSRRRSDGSQFYIVSGRRYFDEELDEIEEQNNYKFSPGQRRAYKTIGGAPHLDGTYTIFGEVVSGMEIVDKIEKVETDREWRPINNIRLKNVRILK